MRTLRYLLAALAAVLALTATACGDGGGAGTGGAGARLTFEPGRGQGHEADASSTQPRTPDAPLLATVWIVDSLTGPEASSSVPADAEGRARFTIAADGSASGSLGCNRFSARAAVEGAKVTFGPLTTTRMACQGGAGEVERALTRLFGSGPLDWKVQGDALTLTASTGGEAKGITAKAASAAE